MARLSSDFYNGDTVKIARELLGKIIVRTLDPSSAAERAFNVNSAVTLGDSSRATVTPDDTSRATVTFDDTSRAAVTPDDTPRAAVTLDDTSRAAVTLDDTSRATVTPDDTPRAAVTLAKTSRIAAPLILAGRITETEAYIGRCDKACHAYGYRKTARTAPLFLGPGHAYIYLIYGMYHCLNFVTEPEGEPAAVLIRAAEAVTGAAFMRRQRYGERPMTPARIRGFLNGPGKLCQAFALTVAQNGMDLTGDTLFVCDSPADIGLDALPPRREIIRAGPRIGIDYAEEARDFPWRFTLEPEPGN